MGKGIYRIDYEIRTQDEVFYHADSVGDAIAAFYADEQMDFTGAQGICVTDPDGKYHYPFDNED